MDKAPKIYADWIKVLDVLKSAEDDENALALMEKGEIVWQSGVAAMNFRLKRAIDNFQKSYRGDENETIKAIMQLRKELQFLLKVVSIKALPDKEKAELRNIIVAQSNSIQESLEKSSESDRSGKLASIVKNNRVNVQWEG